MLSAYGVPDTMLMNEGRRHNDYSECSMLNALKDVQEILWKLKKSSTTGHALHTLSLILLQQT